MGSIVRDKEMGSYFARFTNQGCDQKTNAVLMLYMRVKLAQSNPKKGEEGHMWDADYERIYKTVRWDNASWIAWQSRFERECTKFWDKRFCLVTPAFQSLAPVMDFPAARPTHRVNVLCRFTLKVANTDPHREVRVVRLHPSEKGNFRSHVYLYDHRDLDMEERKGGQYVTAYHEVGHLLGLDHPACPEGEQRCYGVTKVQIQNVMGSGMKVASYQARPWRLAMEPLFPQTKYTDWDPFPRRMDPVPLSKIHLVPK